MMMDRVLLLSRPLTDLLFFKNQMKMSDAFLHDILCLCFFKGDISKCEAF